MKDEKVINSGDHNVVIGMQSFTHQTETGEKLIVLRLDTESADGDKSLQVLWAFGKDDFQKFFKNMLNCNELFDDKNKA